MNGPEMSLNDYNFVGQDKDQIKPIRDIKSKTSNPHLSVKTI